MRTWLKLRIIIAFANITWRMKGGIADYKVRGICTAEEVTVEEVSTNEKVINFYNTNLNKVMSVLRKDLEFVTVEFE